MLTNAVAKRRGVHLDGSVFNRAYGQYMLRHWLQQASEQDIKVLQALDEAFAKAQLATAAIRPSAFAQRYYRLVKVKRAA